MKAFIVIVPTKKGNQLRMAIRALENFCGSIENCVRVPDIVAQAAEVIGRIALRILEIAFNVVTFPIAIIYRGIELLCFEGDNGRIHREFIRNQPNRNQPNALLENVARLYSPIFEGDTAPTASARIESPPMPEYSLSAEARTALLLNYQIDSVNFITALTKMGLTLSSDIEDGIISGTNGEFIFSVMAALDPEEAAVLPVLHPSSPNPQNLQEFTQKYSIDRFIINRAHVEEAGNLEIPQAPRGVNLRRYAIYMEDLRSGNQFPRDGFHDEYGNKNYDTVLASFNNLNLGNYADRIFHHVVAYLDSLREPVALKIAQAAQLRGQQKIDFVRDDDNQDLREYYNEVLGVLKELNSTFYHCSNRKNTAYEDIYFGRVYPAMSGSAQRPVFEHYTLVALLNLRQIIFNGACVVAGRSRVSLDNESAPTQKYWRRLLGRLYGVPSPLSENDMQFESYARREGSIGENIQTRFRNEYTAKECFNHIKNRLLYQNEELLKGQRLLA